ncbi:hypothetical protein [Picosynechococcus sp. PCC 7117]|uniref:hypothetical protein n=1 Tax=Picosynechococcus sp. PCC 7117 TaxID=195498 RepID=UPI0012EE29EC|nr:hypothetical protein [Picosynechococcus sp. PCC 7117]
MSLPTFADNSRRHYVPSVGYFVFSDWRKSAILDFRLGKKAKWCTRSPYFTASTSAAV